MVRLLACAAWTIQLTAQSDPFQALQSQVYDTLFPRNVGDPLFFSKTVLRFGDSGTQTVIIVFGRATGQGEVYQYRLRVTNGRALSQRIWKISTEKTAATAAEIAAGIQVDVTRTPIKAAPFVRVLDELKTIELSPLLASRIRLDDCPAYEFWYDAGGQESICYTLLMPSAEQWPLDRLGRWMLGVQSRLPDLLKEAAEPGR